MHLASGKLRAADQHDEDPDADVSASDDSSSDSDFAGKPPFATQHRRPSRRTPNQPKSGQWTRQNESVFSPNAPTDFSAMKTSDQYAEGEAEDLLSGGAVYFAHANKYSLLSEEAKEDEDDEDEEDDEEDDKKYENYRWLPIVKELDSDMARDLYMVDDLVAGAEAASFSTEQATCQFFCHSDNNFVSDRVLRRASCFLSSCTELLCIVSPGHRERPFG